ncbi:hypothetical protein [Microbacterium arborescens]|uniref:hypothetical protein n=1 Tax=Microbacterium arborescens TaxID=33883 RepID=UPI003C73C2F3
MRVTVDLDPRDVWRIEETAQRRGITPGEVLRAELSTRRSHLERNDRIRARVLAGMTDKQIADELGVGVTSIRDIRQKQLRLPANRTRSERKTA